MVFARKSTKKIGKALPNNSFSNINSPNMPDRQNWLNKISYTEWWTDEIDQGIPWRRIKQRLIEKYL